VGFIFIFRRLFSDTISELIFNSDETRHSHSEQSLMQEHVCNINRSTQGLGERFLEYVEESRRWQEDLIAAIHRDDLSAQDRGLPPIEADTERTRKLQNHLLERLYFPEMGDRENRIVEAHEKTFRWIYCDPEVGSTPWPSFIEWLNSGSGLYWITGKAGSGKSTLMKYIINNPQTFASLRAWSSGTPLVTAGFFFWNSGSKMQMSLIGLLQSILYQLLVKHPDLVPKILPERWEAYTLFGNDPQPWTQEELSKALKLLASEEAVGTKFCFFIDGLDEFDGDHSELNTLLKDAASSGYVKICVASRPWNVFEDAFGERSFLMLQDLTHGDIQAYVESRFEGNPGFAELEVREPKYARELKNHISKKASGVFLWVYLVVKSLLAGLVNGDRVADLEKRLDLLPPDLEDLYHKMLNSLDPFYYSHASQFFQIIRAAHECPTLLTLSFADEEPDFIFECVVRSLTYEERIARADIMRRRLNSRCKGLLEVASSTTIHHRGMIANPLQVSDHFEEAEELTLAGSTVQYLHRTVKDFLELPSVWQALLGHGPENFDPNLALLRGYVSQFKHMNPNNLDRDAFWTAIRRCIEYVGVNEHTEQSVIDILDELDRSASKLANAPCLDGSTFIARYSRIVDTGRTLWPHWTCTFAGYADDRGFTFLSLAVKLKLYFYVHSKVTENCLVTQSSGLWSLLSDAVIVEPDFQTFFNIKTFPDLLMVTLLLERGANPNWKKTPSHPSVFECALRQATKDKSEIELARLRKIYVHPGAPKKNVGWHHAKVVETARLGVRAVCNNGALGFTWIETIYQFLAHGADPRLDLDARIGLSFMGALKSDVQVVSNTGIVKSWLGIGAHVNVYKSSTE